MRAAAKRPDVRIVAVRSRRQRSRSWGSDVGELAGSRAVGTSPSPAISRAALGARDVAIDFSAADATAANLAACRAARKPLLIGTTGLRRGARGRRSRGGARHPVLVAPNTSLGVNAAHRARARLRASAAARASTSRSSKRITARRSDAPSGTALALGAAAAAAPRHDLAEARQRHARLAPASAARATSAFPSIRGGDIVGEHTVLFAGAGRAARARRTGPRTGRSSPAARSARRPGWRSGRPASMPCGTCWVIKQTLSRSANFALSRHRCFDAMDTRLPSEFRRIRKG